MTHSSDGRKERTDLETNKPYAVFGCNKFTKDADMADKYLNYYSDPRKTVQRPNVSAKLYTLKCIFVYITLNINKKHCTIASSNRHFPGIRCPESK